MKGKNVVVLGLAVMVSLPLVAAAQGLGDAAARERARREKEAARGHDRRSFSNEDLEKGRPPVADKKKKTTSSPASSGQAPSSTSDTATSSESDSPSPRSEPPEPPESATAGVEARIQELRDKLNPMSGSFIYGATGSNDPSEESRVRRELQEAEAQLARARESASAGDAGSGEGSERTPE